MPRQIVLDTETTGLEPPEAHRIIEIGCVELIDRRPTGKTFHYYLQPDRDIEQGAEAVHGINREFLADKPRFADIAEDFLGFVTGAELIIHNAPFDVGFLDRELKRLGSMEIARVCKVLDSLALARRLHPGQKNSLDALCRRYRIDSSERQYHGALLDSQILADVYLAMTGGQVALSLESESGDLTGAGGEIGARHIDRAGLTLCVIRATSEELAAHERRLDAIAEASGGQCLWRESND
jgi:DNA polymerase-3 subunit epsilon